MSRVVVYTDKITSRLKYVCSFIFQEVLKMPLLLTSNRSDLTGEDYRIGYSLKIMDGVFRIPPAGLLAENGIHEQDVPVVERQEAPCLFPVSQGNIAFDAFSAIFYLLSRYEEYLPAERDQFGRFPSTQSIAGKNRFLHIPVVNIWINELADKLKEFYPDFPLPGAKTHFIPTIDIDNPWAFLNKPFCRVTGGILKDVVRLNMKHLSQRLKVLGKWEKDPFDSYDRIEKLHDPSLKIFYLLGHKSKRDNPVCPENYRWNQLIYKLSKKFSPGIHPSFHSSENENLVKYEKELLERITGKKIIASRQHFLKMTLPATYRNLLFNGIFEDYSMGYADQPGFRAGTSHSFFFYDLEIEETTPLRIFPFSLMDRTLKDYLGLSISEAKELIAEQISTIRHYGGNFIPVWHNESLGTAAEWQGWNEVYEYMMNEAKTLSDQEGR